MIPATMRESSPRPRVVSEINEVKISVIVRPENVALWVFLAVWFVLPLESLTAAVWSENIIRGVTGGPSAGFAAVGN